MYAAAYRTKTQDSKKTLVKLPALLPEEFALTFESKNPDNIDRRT